MKRLTFSLFLIALLLATSCSEDVASPTPPSINATVVFVDLEGGCWVLITKNGKRYEPVNLAPGFRKDGLRVLVTLTPRTDLGSFCMVGELVEIASIRVR